MFFKQRTCLHLAFTTCEVMYSILAKRVLLGFQDTDAVLDTPWMVNQDRRMIKMNSDVSLLVIQGIVRISI